MAARSMLRRAIVGLLVLQILVSSPWSSHHAAGGGRAIGMTTVDPPVRFTYDVPTVSRPGRSNRAAEASRTQPRLVRFGLGPQSIEAASVSTTAVTRSVATEAESGHVTAEEACNSFKHHTDVLMADGTRKPIDKVKVGASVIALACGFAVGVVGGIIGYLAADEATDAIWEFGYEAIKR
jgi:hypothetical protein